MKKQTKWKRVYHPMIGVMFHDNNKYRLGYYTIEKLWECKRDTGYGGRRLCHMMMKVRTHNGFVYKMPFPYADNEIVDDYGKSLFKYCFESPFMDKKEKIKHFFRNLKV